MSMQDPIADMLTRVRNGGMAALEQVEMPASRMKAAIAAVLQEEGFITAFREEGEGTGKQLIVQLKYHQREPVIEGIKRISKPSCRVYCGSDAIPKIRNGLGVVVLSTPQGVISGSRALADKVGGEILFYVW